MVNTNFLVFDEGKQNMMSDGDYSANTQRARGVTPGIAYPNLHNKLYYQVSVMAKAIADFMVAQGVNASDEDVEQLTADIATAFTNFVDNQTKDVYLPLSGGTLKGNLNADGNNITADDFIGNLQGTATKAQQDKNGLEIDSNYIKNIQNNKGVLTITKGNDTTSQLTINSVIATSNVPSNGWRKYQDNFIVEWGNKLNIPVNAQPTKIIFPVAVKTVLGAWATIQRGDIPNVVICPYLQSFDTNGMEVVIDYEIGQSFVPGSEITNVVWGIYGLL